MSPGIFLIDSDLRDAAATIGPSFAHPARVARGAILRIEGDGRHGPAVPVFGIWPVNLQSRFGQKPQKAVGPGCDAADAIRGDDIPQGLPAGKSRPGDAHPFVPHSGTWTVHKLLHSVLFVIAVGGRGKDRRMDFTDILQVKIHQGEHPGNLFWNNL